MTAPSRQVSRGRTLSTVQTLWRTGPRRPLRRRGSMSPTEKSVLTLPRICSSFSAVSERL